MVEELWESSLGQRDWKTTWLKLPAHLNKPGSEQSSYIVGGSSPLSALANLKAQGFRRHRKKAKV